MASEALRQLVRHIDSLGGTPAALEALRLLRMKLFSAPRMVHKLSDCVLEYLNTVLVKVLVVDRTSCTLYSGTVVQ